MNSEKFKDILINLFGDKLKPVIDIDEQGIVSLTLPTEMIPYFIGKQGRNIKAVRELIYLYNKLHNTNFSLKLVE